MNGSADPYSFLVRPAHMPRGSLANHVADQFRDAIVSLRLKPGTMLDREKICDRLGISRSPVSEAMMRLKGEGLIDILPQRGTVVSLVSISDVTESIFVRKGLESEAVRALALSRPDGLIEALSENIDQQRSMLETGELSGFHALDVKFHHLLIGAVGLERIKAIVESARNNLNRARRLTNSTKRVSVAIEEHAGIVDAIKSGDADAAANRMREHLDGVLARVHELARDHPHLFDGDIITLSAIDLLHRDGIRS